MTKDKQFPLRSEFDDYLKEKGLKDDNRENTISRMATLLINGYQRGRIKFTDPGLDECINAIPDIIKSKKDYHNIALQALAAVFTNLRREIDKKGKKSTLNDLQSALVHFYNFIEIQLNQSNGRGKRIRKDKADHLQELLNNFWGHSFDVTCFTQKEVRDNFRLRLHSQNRLYNRKLLFPITLIEKLLGSAELAESWTYDVIGDIDILVSKDKKSIQFKDVSFFQMCSNGIFIFDRKGKKYPVYTRTYEVVEKAPKLMIVHRMERPLQSFAIDHVKSMMQLIADQTSHLGDVVELKRLSVDFIDYITAHGKENIKKSWIEGHPRSEGIDLLTSKTINDLANGYLQFIKGNQRPISSHQKSVLIEDLKKLHSNGRLELMDLFENGKKGADI